MSENNIWLRKQRVAGGTGFSSSMLRTQANTDRYISHILEVVEQERGIALSLEKSFHDYHITCDENIVWFGRDIDVELLRATTATAFEDYLNARLDRLIELELIEEQTEERMSNK